MIQVLKIKKAKQQTVLNQIFKPLLITCVVLLLMGVSLLIVEHKAPIINAQDPTTIEKMYIEYHANYTTDKIKASSAYTGINKVKNKHMNEMNDWLENSARVDTVKDSNEPYRVIVAIDQSGGEHFFELFQKNKKGTYYLYDQDKKDTIKIPLSPQKTKAFFNLNFWSLSTIIVVLILGLACLIYDSLYKHVKKESSEYRNKYYLVVFGLFFILYMYFLLKEINIPLILFLFLFLGMTGASSLYRTNLERRNNSLLYFIRTSYLFSAIFGVYLLIENYLLNDEVNDYSIYMGILFIVQGLFYYIVVKKAKPQYCPHCEEKVSYWQMFKLNHIVFLPNKCTHCNQQLYKQNKKYPMYIVAMGILLLSLSVLSKFLTISIALLTFTPAWILINFICIAPLTCEYYATKPIKGGNKDVD